MCIRDSLLDAQHLRLAHRHPGLGQSDVRGSRLLERPRAPLVLVHGRRGDPAVMPQQRLDLDRDQFQPPGARHVVPGPAVRCRHRRDGVPQLVPGGREGRVRRHVVRQPQFVDAETLRRLRDLRGRPRVRREVGIAVLVHPYPSRVTGGSDRVREMHDLPGVGRVRRHGSLPEPTCRHGGCPLRRSGTARDDPPRPLRPVSTSLHASTAWIAVPTAYAVRRHGSPGTGQGPSASVTSRHLAVTARPNPGVSHRPSFRTSHAIWHSVSSGGMLGRG